MQTGRMPSGVAFMLSLVLSSGRLSPPMPYLMRNTRGDMFISIIYPREATGFRALWSRASDSRRTSSSQLLSGTTVTRQPANRSAK